MRIPIFRHSNLVCQRYVMKWYKASNRLIDDPKLRLISHKNNVPHYVTVVTLHSLLERCSQSMSCEFGCRTTIAEEINLQTGLDVICINRCLTGMEESNIITANRLINWENYQANDSANRVRKWRDKQKNVTDVTLRNVTVTDVTQRRGEENRIEEIREDKVKGTRLRDFLLKELPAITVEKQTDFMPDAFSDLWETKRGGKEEQLFAEWEKFVKYFSGADAKRPVKKDWLGAWRNWIVK